MIVSFCQSLEYDVGIKINVGVLTEKGIDKAKNSMPHSPFDWKSEGARAPSNHLVHL